MKDLPAFRLGDIRGIYPEDIDEAFVAAFAHAFVGRFGLSGSVATGRDMRTSSEGLQRAINAALSSIGIDVIDIGMCPTELGYFASGLPGIEAAVIVTASHNPAAYNGLKCVLKGGRAITSDTGLADIKAMMQRGYRHRPSQGSVTRENFHDRYLEFLSRRFPMAELREGHVALNGLNGTAAITAGMIAEKFELPVTWFREEPGPIPVQGADPTHPGLAGEMQSFMRSGSFSLGIAWDGDCDRCVCFDGDGNLIPAYYLIGLLIEHQLAKSPGGAIVFDTKLCWNTTDIIRRLGGVPVPAETGHAFMKQSMHAHKAVYGGELSSHHYFGDFFGCDSGMFAWLTVLSLLRDRGIPMRDLVARCREEILITPEINLSLTDVDRAFEEVLRVYRSSALHIDYFDGLSFSMPGNWRFSLTRSKTEPVVRVNFETRRNAEVLLAEGPSVFAVLEAFRSDQSDWLAEFRIQ